MKHNIYTLIICLAIAPILTFAQQTGFYSTLTGSWVGKIEIPAPSKQPLPYRSMDITFNNPTLGIELGGTLTMPEGDGRYKAVILVSAAGQQSRDGEMPGHRPFRVIADYLTRAGFAVLRYDDRGTGISAGDYSNATPFDLSTDVQSALEFLRTNPEIDTSAIGLLGQGEGGLIASIAASVRNDVAFVILLGSPAITGAKELVLQSGLIAKSEGLNEREIKETTSLQKDIYEVLKKTSDDAKASLKIRSMLDSFSKKHATDKRYINFIGNDPDHVIKILTSPGFRGYLALNPEPYISAIKCPVLAINGSLDLQVSAKENLEAVEKALIFGGNPNYTTEELPELNHHLQTVTTGSPSFYSKTEETISPVALELVLSWLKKNLR